MLCTILLIHLFQGELLKAMRIMEANDNRQLLDNVTISDVPGSFMMQRIGVESSALLNTELLPAHSGLVVDMSNTEYLPAVSYAADELLGHDLTEEDRNLAAALVAVQFVQQQKQQHQLHQDSNVIVSTSSLASFVSASHLENDKTHLSDEQLVITSVDKSSNAVLTNVSSSYMDVIEEARNLQHQDSIVQLKKYGTMLVNPHPSYTTESVKTEYIPVKKEHEHHTEDSLQQLRDSDCENRNDGRASKKSLPHKKRISRKLKKTCTTSRRNHRCTLCDEVFSTADELATHTSRQHTVKSQTSFSCQLCGCICNDQLLFFKHLKMHYEPNTVVVERRAQCSESVGASNESGGASAVSDKLVPNKTLNGAVEVKSDEPKDSLLRSLLSPLDCIHCGKTFRKQKAFEEHMANHNNKTEILADDDEDEFSEPEDLMEGIRGVVEANNHDSSEEGVDSKVWYQQDTRRVSNDYALNESILPDMEVSHGVCNLCGHESESPEQLMQHLNECQAVAAERIKMKRNKKRRRKNGQFFCPHCDRVFTHRNSLMYHMKGHSGERPHQCDICGKSFFATSALKVHMRVHSGDKPYKCEYCERHFRQWGDLKHHCISIHTDQKQYQCEYCGKDFARKYSLVVHRRIHTGEKNYRCEFCCKTFRASSYLQNHRRIHTGEKPHPCEVCGKPFRVRSDMKRHLITHLRRRSTGKLGRNNAENANADNNEGNSVIQGKDAENSESIMPDNDDSNVVIETQELIEAAPSEHDEPVSGDNIEYQRDPLETSREETNTLYSNGHHVFICYPPTRSTMESQWIQSDG